MPDDEDEDDFVPQLKKMGPLFKVGWFRVVLDEAQVCSSFSFLLRRLKLMDLFLV